MRYTLKVYTNFLITASTRKQLRAPWGYLTVEQDELFPLLPAIEWLTKQRRIVG
jgi:hypothetical protein